jgi:hypothetical protein
MHQSTQLHRRVPHGALVRLERSAVKSRTLRSEGGKEP